MVNLPQIHASHHQEKISIRKLEHILPNNLFILRAEDGGDYGVDRIIEVIKNGSVTNIRSHIQIKSINKSSDKKGIIKYPIERKTLNYLLNSLNSLFLVYSIKEDQFYWEWAGTIELKIRDLEIRSKRIGKKTFSYTFSSKLDKQSFQEIHRRLVKDTEFIKKVNLSPSPFEKVIITDLIHEKTYRDYLSLYADGKFEKIIALIKENPADSPELNSLISLCYYNIYNYDEALKYILKSEQQSPNDAFQKIKVAILCEKGLMDNNRETLESAKQLFLAIKNSDLGWMDLYNYGNILTGLEEYEEAESYYLNAIKLDAKVPMIWKNLSNIYKQQKDFEKELECLNTALSLDEDLIEALICKGISLGKNFSKFSEAIDLLKRSLTISKSMMINNSSIYFWISCFYNELKDYKSSLFFIEEGLQYHPGDKYLENNRVRTLLLASKHDVECENKAIDFLQQALLKYPNNIKIKIELLELLGRRKPVIDLMPIINECFQLKHHYIEHETILNMDVASIISMIQHMGIIQEFREKNEFGKMFFQKYDVKIADVQKIEMRVEFLFSSLNSKIMNCKSDNELLSILDQHARKFLELNELCSEILVKDFTNENTEKKSNMIMHLILTLPEILLTEFSREIGWLLQRNGYDIEIADTFINTSSILKDWFSLCLEPILKGANNILKWAKE